MPRPRLFLSLALLAALLVGSALPASAAAVWSVLTVRVDGDPTNWLGLVKQAAGIRQRLGLTPPSIVQATLAGDATGLFFVSFEYPSLAALEEAGAKVNADPAWAPLLAQLGAASKVESSALYTDRTPAGAKSSPMTPGGYSMGIIVRTDDPAAYLALLPRLAANSTRLGNPVARVWQATAAGDGTGAIVLTIAYPTLAALEQAQAKMEADADAQDLMRDFEASGRKVVARLLVRDRTPR